MASPTRAGGRRRRPRSDPPRAAHAAPGAGGFSQHTVRPLRYNVPEALWCQERDPGAYLATHTHKVIARARCALLNRQSMWTRHSPVAHEPSPFSPPSTHRVLLASPAGTVHVTAGSEAPAQSGNLTESWRVRAVVHARICWASQTGCTAHTVIGTAASPVAALARAAPCRALKPSTQLPDARTVNPPPLARRSEAWTAPSTFCTTVCLLRLRGCNAADRECWCCRRQRDPFDPARGTFALALALGPPPCALLAGGNGLSGRAAHQRNPEVGLLDG